MKKLIFILMLFAGVISAQTPMRIIGIDSTGAKHTVKVDTSGNLIISQDWKLLVSQASGDTLDVDIGAVTLNADSLTQTAHTSGTQGSITLSGSATQEIGSTGGLALEVYVPVGSSGSWGYDSNTYFNLSEGTFLVIDIDDPNKIYFKGSGTIYYAVKK